jgi:replicative DNA helicase
VTDSAIRCEREVLGAILADNSQLRNVQLQQRDFSVAAHGQIFELARRLIGAGKVMDAVTMASALERETGRNEWLEMTVRLQQDCLAPSNAPSYAAVVRKASMARQAATIGQRLVAGGEDVISGAIRDLIELSSTTREHACHISDAVKDAMDALTEIVDGKPPGVMTGMRDLDEALGGMHDEDLIVVGARPAMGKTAFMINLALAANVGVGVISGEQGRGQIGMRAFAMQGPVSLHHMRIGKLNDDEWSRLAYAIGQLKARPFWINDKPGPTIDEVVAQARAWRFHNNIGLLMIDYLQKIRGGHGQDFRLQVGDIAVQLKNLARELKIPVVALAQVNRSVEARPLGQDGLGRMPYMSDLAEAGIIEQEADQVITLYRPEVYDDSEFYRGIAYTNICKNRHGPVGHKAVSWRGEYLKFGDLARQEISHQDRWSAA